VQATAAFSGRNGRIVYSRHLVRFGDVGIGKNQLFIINRDGTGRRRLTFRGSSGDPSWGPHGHRILFTHEGRRGVEVWLMRANGTHQRPVVRGTTGFSSQASWAPGGHRFVLARFNPALGFPTLYVYRFRTGRTRPIVIPGFQQIATHPAWSPAGRRIAFAGLAKVDTPGGAGFQTELYTVRPNGRGLRRVTSTGRWLEDYPDWAPDGRTLVYQRTQIRASTPCQELDTINPDGTHRQRLHAGCHAAVPVWAPNGKRILAHMAPPKGPAGLWTMAPGGGHRRFLVAGGSGEWQPRP